MEKVFVAQRVANKLFSTEAAVEQAIVEASEFMAEMIKARAELKASMTLGDDAQVRLMEGLKALSEARTAMANVHAELAETKLRLGIRTRMVGEYTEPTMQAGGQQSLRQVG